MAPKDGAAGRKRKREESSSTSSSSPGINWEVFLNFRGPDTRKGFTDHVHSRLVGAGIQVFRDDEDLPAGQEIKPELRKVIKQSRISIAIFSKNYASSKHCLMELVQMWKCRKYNEHTIIPIFYDVSPSDVKDQAGDFITSIDQLAEEGVDADTITNWKKVLGKIGKLRGYERKNVKGGHESQLVEKVLRRVWRVLKKDDQLVTDKLVGIDRHVEEMMTKLGAVYSQGKTMRICGEDVRVIGILGMSGVGKTTLAKVVFNNMRKLFDGCSFLEGINSKEIEASQKMLIEDLQKENCKSLRSSDEGIKIISNRFTKMKVLIVLDDVQKPGQIKELAGKPTWFGSGSRIIVTTNIRNVLKGFDFGEAQDRAAEEYEVKPMEDQDAFQLFRMHACQRDGPGDVSEYENLSRDIVKAIGGIPLAIVLTASNLSVNGNDIEIWKETLDLLENEDIENEDDLVKAVFENSYRYLKINTKKIFLDIACFFIGKDKRIPSYMWKACGYSPARGIQSLCDMYLLEIGKNNELRMHNLFRDFGRKLVKGKDRRKRCRFWDPSDADSIPKGRKRAKHVEGIGLTVEEGSPVCFTCEKFREMSNLRYLRLERAKIQGDATKLPQTLRWLDWRECHSIPELCNMHLKELVILDLSKSLVASDPKIWSRIMEVKELKVLNLQGCGLSGASLKFRAPISLEILILEDCTQLSEIGTFISKVEHLKSLNLRNCKAVKQLPQQLRRMQLLTELLIDGTAIKKLHIQNDSLKNLEKLSACGCEELEDISPIGHLTKLNSLALDGAINWHPENFEFPQNLRRLSLRNCEKLFELPPSIEKLRLLEVMDLSHTGITELPESVKDLRYLKMLKMERTYLQKFPEDILKLENLEEIDFSGCRSLEGQVSCDISGLSSLRILRLSSSSVAGLPQGIRGHSRLQTLDILQCNRLKTLPELPSSLLSLRWRSKNMTVPDLSYLTNLKELVLSDDEQPEEGSLSRTPNIEWITRLPSLESLALSVSKGTHLPGDFCALTQLRELSLSYMKELDLTQLPLSPSLWTLHLKRCKIQEPNFSGLKYLSELELDDCDLAKIDGLKDLQSLEVLKIFPHSRITDLNELKGLRRLRKVQVFPFDAASLSELRERGCEVDTCR